MGRKIINLIGQRFGRLLVINKLENHITSGGYSHLLWECLCDCGIIKSVQGGCLKNGTTQSCGCLSKETSSQNGKNNLIDLTGQKFGRLLVINIDHKEIKNNNYRSYWLCQCICGNIKSIRSSSLIKGDTKSCGCLQKELISNRQKIEYGLSSFNSLYSNYRLEAKRRKINFELQKNDFLLLIKQNCYYCNCEPDQIFNKNSNNGSLTYNGIDRLNNNIGYTIKNCVPCCKICNTAKRNMTIEQFVIWIKRLYSYQKSIL